MSVDSEPRLVWTRNKWASCSSKKGKLFVVEHTVHHKRILAIITLHQRHFRAILDKGFAKGSQIINLGSGLMRFCDSAVSANPKLNQQ